jgi:hypothetical protein
MCLYISWVKDGLGLAKVSMTAQTDIELVSAKEVSQEQLGKFYELAFPRRARYLVSNWMWHYGGPNGSNLSCWPLVAVAPSGQVLGHVATIPSTFDDGVDGVSAAWFVDFFVLPAARSLGVGGELIRRVMRASPLMMAIAVSKYSLPIFRRYGWREVPGPTRLSSVIQFKDFCPAQSPRLWRVASSMIDVPLNSLRSRAINLEGRTGVYGDTTEIDRCTALDLLTLGVDQHIWDNQLIEWRLNDSQIGGRILLHQAGEEIALSRVFRNQDRIELHVLSFGGRVSSVIFGYLLRWAIRENVSRVVIVTGNQTIKRLARKHLFFGKPMTPFFFSENKSLLERICSSPPNLQMIDSDLDMALPDTLVA